MNMRMMLTLLVLVVMTTDSASERGNEAKTQALRCRYDWDDSYDWCKRQGLVPGHFQTCCLFVNSIPELPNRTCDDYD
nr:conotoxin K M16.2 [Conus magus]